ncbi:MAG: hypothetical protein E7Z96_02700 [Actinomycetaceae bacterium]|nr:hypothetical protein [Actinomycetaceae bacterium]
MVRKTELTTARRQAAKKTAGGDPRTVMPVRTATLVSLTDDDGKVVVSMGGEELTLPAAPGAYVEDGRVSVLVDTAGRPYQVLGPLEAHPANLDADIQPVKRIVLPELAGDLDAAKHELEQAGAARDERIAQAEEALRQAAATLEAVKAGDIEPTAELWLKLLRVAGDATIGGNLLVLGEINAADLTVTEDLWAKLAAFVKVTTDMLVAGRATITNELLVDTLRGKTLVGVQVLGGLFELLSAVERSAGWDQSRYSQAVETDWRATSTMIEDGVSVAVRLAVPAAWQFEQDWDGVIWLNYQLDAATDPDRAVSFTLESTAHLSGKIECGGDITPITLQKGTPQTVTLAGEHVTGLLRIKLTPARNQNSFTVCMTGLTDSYHDYLPTGLRIDRDDAGIAQLVYTSPAGTCVLNPLGISYTPAGGTGRTVEWGTFVNPPVAIASRTSNRALGNGNWYNAVLDAATAYTVGGFIYDDGRLTAPVSGVYRLGGLGKFAHHTTGRRGVGFSINDGSPDTNTVSAAVSGTSVVECNALVRLNAGDRIKLMLYQDSGTTLASTAAEFSAQYVTA